MVDQSGARWLFPQSDSLLHINPKHIQVSGCTSSEFEDNIVVPSQKHLLKAKRGQEADYAHTRARMLRKKSDKMQGENRKIDDKQVMEPRQGKGCDHRPRAKISIGKKGLETAVVEA